MQQNLFIFTHHGVIPQYALWAYIILRQQYFTFPEEIYHFPVRENIIGGYGNPFPHPPFVGGAYCLLYQKFNFSYPHPNS